MPRSAVLYLFLLALVGAERVFEVALSARNARRAVGRGAIEAGREHFPAMAALHGAFFAACVAEVLLLERAFPGAVGWVALGLVMLAQSLRYWVVAVLGDRWNVRIIVEPGRAPVTEGPYRLVRHPNYAAVVIEMFCLPMVHGAWITAVVFSALNAAMLLVRIRAEEAALLAQTPYGAHFERRPRFVPWPRAGEGSDAR